MPSKAVSCEAWISVMQLSGSLCGCFLFHFFGSRWLSASAEAQPRAEYSPNCLLLHSPNLFSILPLSKDVNIKQRISRLPQGHSFLSESFQVLREKMRKLHLGGKTSLRPFIPLWKNHYQYPTVSHLNNLCLLMASLIKG